MTTDPHAPSIYPTLRYKDATAAIDVLVGTLGLTEHQVTKADDGTLVHAELAWGNGLLMVGTRSDQGDSPFDTGQCCLYLAVDDPDAHHDRAVAAGAEILMALTDQPYGSREYATSDPEGNVWCFGTYQPSPSPAT